jgi:phosphoglycerate kinase
VNLPKLSDFNYKDKRVLVRVDFDVPLEDGKVDDGTRIQECLPTIEYLLNQGAKIILLGHLGRPQGEDESLSLAPVAEHLRKLLNRKGKIESVHTHEDLDDNLYLLENLRFDPREEANDPGFAQELAEMGDFYVNEAFATSHRAHTSIVGIPKLLPHAAGLHFQKEVEGLSRALENPINPLVFVIGGAKPETKLPLVEEFRKRANRVLVGGKLAAPNALTPDNLDINVPTIESFKEVIASAGTIVLNGTMGKYEDPKAERGTKEIFEAVANSKAFKITGGGDTIAALTKFNLIAKMDYVSTAGGAMLEFLAKGTLPGIEALNG